MLVNIFKFSLKILCDYVNLYLFKKKKNNSQTSVKFFDKIMFKIIESYFVNLIYFVYSKYRTTTSDIQKSESTFVSFNESVKKDMERIYGLTLLFLISNLFNGCLPVITRYCFPTISLSFRVQTKCIDAVTRMDNKT